MKHRRGNPHEFASREKIEYQVLMKRWLDERICEEAKKNQVAVTGGLPAAREDLYPEAPHNLHYSLPTASLSLDSQHPANVIQPPMPVVHSSPKSG